MISKETRVLVLLLTMMLAMPDAALGCGRCHDGGVVNSGRLSGRPICRIGRVRPGCRAPVRRAARAIGRALGRVGRAIGRGIRGFFGRLFAYESTVHPPAAFPTSAEPSFLVKSRYSYPIHS